MISKTFIAPGDVSLTIRAKGKKLRKLNDTGKVEVTPRITYTPTSRPKRLLLQHPHP